MPLILNHMKSESNKKIQVLVLLGIWLRLHPKTSDSLPLCNPGFCKAYCTLVVRYCHVTGGSPI